MAPSNKNRRAGRDARAPAARKGGRRRGKPPGPRVRDRGVKISHPAVARLRAGHPWVFRDSLLRPLGDVAPGAPLPLADPDGAPLGVALAEPEGAIALRVVSLDPGFHWQDAAVGDRVRRARARREAWCPELLAGAHRVLHGDGEGLPGVAVDRYGDYLVLHRYARAAARFQDALVAALVETYAPKAVYLQDRTRPVTADEPRGAAQLLTGKAPEPGVEVQEDGLTFGVDVTAPVSPGLFLDLREGRRWVEQLARDRRVLNLFSFTGAFALRAVRGGASEVVNVDAAARSHAACRKNLAASGFDPEACEAVVGDVFKHLERFRQRGRAFDLVVVDPPPFSKVGSRTFSALDQWGALMEAVCGVLAPDARVLAVSNAAGLDEVAFADAIGHGSARAGQRLSLIGERGLPPDFPVPPAFAEGRYLRVRLLGAG